MHCASRTQFVKGNLFNKGGSVMILWSVQSFTSLDYVKIDGKEGGRGVDLPNSLTHLRVADKKLKNQ
jgi:hypothetical protein